MWGITNNGADVLAHTPPISRIQRLTLGIPTVCQPFTGVLLILQEKMMTEREDC